jgi:hypothetical protein
LRTLELSCRSFPNAHPLFSMLCGLFCQNTRVCGVSTQVHSTKKASHDRPSRLEAP